jgi:hypothetical protein
MAHLFLFLGYQGTDYLKRFCICSHLPLLFGPTLLIALPLTGAGTAVFWVIGASIVFIVLHAALFAYESEVNDAFDLQMEEI